MKRIGEQCKCPACGVQIDNSAYRCPRCLIYFCYKCRLRVQKNDPQYQCMNQQCEQHGKLLCSNCVIEMPIIGNKVVQETVEEGKEVKAESTGCIIASLLIPIVALIILAIWNGIPWWAGLIAGVILGGYWALNLATNTTYKEPVFRTVEHRDVEIGRSKCCIDCHSHVEHLGND